MMVRKSVAFFDLGVLLTSKIGGILAGLLFMPLFLQILGQRQFGMVAIILSFQAFLMMLDLGMSTLLGRQVAEFGPSIVLIRNWKSAELLLSVFYILIAIVVSIINIFYSVLDLNQPEIYGVVILFWALALQNVGQSILTNARSFRLASTIQLVGVAARGGVTYLALTFIDPTLNVFIFSQLGVSLVHLWFTRNTCLNYFGKSRCASIKVGHNLSNSFALLKEGKHLLLFGLAGAAVMQLDKPLIAAFFSVDEVGLYFLAATFCMAPIAVLAGPIAQYFQPHVISRSPQTAGKNKLGATSNFVFILVSITVMASITLWVYREFWISLWLHNSLSPIGPVATYVSILLPGIAAGSLGYIPFTLLISHQDYRFQSILSTTLTVITLSFTAYFAHQKNIYGICWIYALYHFSSTIFSWIRAISIAETRDDAIRSIALAALLIFIITSVSILIIYILGYLFFNENKLVLFMAFQFIMFLTLVYIFYNIRNIFLIKIINL